MRIPVEVRPEGATVRRRVLVGAEIHNSGLPYLRNNLPLQRKGRVEQTEYLRGCLLATVALVVYVLVDSLGLTVLLTTHDLDSLWGLADRIIVLFEGKVIGGVQAMCSAAGTPVAAVVGDSAPEVRDRIRHRSLVLEFGEERAMREPLWCIEHAAIALLQEN